ncbi:hypothetical protein PCASD_24408 [Puccinia coronata f. sp. avenae]|uniref:Uncharacterized protein n=1 Tax=Puccinia coronata f. sp. avenae TaxID=200324 RepID=A0A2N5TMD4_9BASI|nr:hypothetical protein PCASD_24408 [Puccinia coronata f. sp. avenae]
MSQLLMGINKEPQAIIKIIPNGDNKPKLQRKGYTSYAAQSRKASHNSQSSTKSAKQSARPTEQAKQLVGPLEGICPNGNQPASSLTSRITASVPNLTTRISPRTDNNLRIQA